MIESTTTLPTLPQSHSHGYTRNSGEMSALSLEVAKCLKLVAPASMNADAQMAWIASACDALEGIRSEEVRHVSAEVRRSVTRPAQIVPEIARLVSLLRHRRAQSSEPVNDNAAAERAIGAEAAERRGRAKTQAEVEAAWAWERRARMSAGLPVMPLAPPLTRDELDELPREIVALGLKGGFLERRGDKLYELPIAA